MLALLSALTSAFHPLQTLADAANLAWMNDVERARAKIAEALEGAFAGEISLIEAVRRVAPLVERAGFDPLSQPFATLVAIESETDDIPLGSVRNLRQPDAVAKHGPDWERAESWAKRYGESECRQVLALVRAA